MCWWRKSAIFFHFRFAFCKCTNKAKTMIWICLKAQTSKWRNFQYSLFAKKGLIVTKVLKMPKSFQLRLDFQTMSGYVTTTNGVCTDSFTALGLKKFFGTYRFSFFSQGKYGISRYVLLTFGEILWLLSILLFSQTGQTGKTVPSICGTNTDYHSKYFCHILVYSIV